MLDHLENAAVSVRITWGLLGICQISDPLTYLRHLPSSNGHSKLSVEFQGNWLSLEVKTMKFRGPSSTPDLEQMKTPNACSPSLVSRLCKQDATRPLARGV